MKTESELKKNIKRTRSLLDSVRNKLAYNIQCRDKAIERIKANELEMNTLAATLLHDEQELHSIVKYPSIELTQCSLRAEVMLKAAKGSGTQDKPSHHRRLYPWHLMLVGDSFYIPFERTSRPNLDTAGRSYAYNKGKVFRIVNHNNINSYEVVRVK